MVANLKYSLIHFKVTFSEINDCIFNGYRLDDLVSIYEFTRILNRLTRKSKDDCENLARYIIEPENYCEYNIYLKTTVQAASDKINRLIGVYTLVNEDDIRESLYKVMFYIIYRN